MSSKLTDLIDIQSMQALMDSLHQITGVSAGILEADGQVLVAAGWRDVCVKFHLENPQSQANCQLTRCRPKEFLAAEAPDIVYECANGLRGSNAVIRLNGEAVGSVVAGQYLTSPPDFNFFKEQATRYGYDISSYLAAVSQVPIIAQQRVDNILAFFRQLAETMAQVAYAQSLQSKHQQQALRESEEKYTTERNQLEQEIHRLDRLNLVGQLAASIGHEVRNPMTTVRGYLQLMRSKPEAKFFSRQIDIMIEEIDRANSIITEFLTLAKNKAINPVCKNLNDIIEALAPLLEASALAGNHSLKLRLSPLPNLLIDEKEARQLILNLARNGLEAMENGGCLTIETYISGMNAVMAVRDEGSGIAPTVREHLGTPFVTTKESGTGLGLAVCYSIAARHRAQIQVESSSEGTAFIVMFEIE